MNIPDLSEAVVSPRGPASYVDEAPSLHSVPPVLLRETMLLSPLRMGDAVQLVFDIWS